MLSRAREARVREVLGSQPPGTLLFSYCLEHLAANTQIPLAHLAHLGAFVRSLRAYGPCQTRYGSIVTPTGHETRRLLIRGPLTPMTARSSEPRHGAGGVE